MPRLAANLSMLFGTEPLAERLRRTRAAGFRAVEILFPYEWAVSDIRAQLNDAGSELVLINTPPGDWDAGERGLAAVPGREDDFRVAFASALDYATALDCPRIHVMAGIRTDDPDACDMCFVRNLQYAAREAGRFSVEVLIEPLNDRDVPGYHLSRLDHAERILASVDAANAGLQFDFYHTRIMEGDVEDAYTRSATRVRHTQIAGLPDRHEPSSGLVDGRELLQWLDTTGYTGWVGCEYRPRTTFEDGLAWAEPFGIAAPPGSRTG